MANLVQDENLEIMDVVDDNDVVIGQATREEIYNQKLLHRIVHVLIFNPEGKLGLQKRSMNKSYLPGYWVTSASGHVMTGENYIVSGEREMFEELGLTMPLNLVNKLYYFDSSRNLGRFLGVLDLRINQTKLDVKNDEVDSLDFFTFEEIKLMLQENEKFHPELIFLLDKVFNIK